MESVQIVAFFCCLAILCPAVAQDVIYRTTFNLDTANTTTFTLPDEYPDAHDPTAVIVDPNPNMFSGASVSPGPLTKRESVERSLRISSGLTSYVDIPLAADFFAGGTATVSFFLSAPAAIDGTILSFNHSTAGRFIVHTISDALVVESAQHTLSISDCAQSLSEGYVHYGIVFGTILKMYRNGILIGSESSPTFSLATGLDKFYLGLDVDGTLGVGDFRIDDIIISNIQNFTSDCDSNPCANGGSCYPGVFYTCLCTSGFDGENCEYVNNCDSSPCQNGGECDNANGSFDCVCSSPFVGDLCDTVDPDQCASSPCQNGGNCSDAYTSFTCTCADAYTGTLCEQDLDECASSPCQNAGTCENLIDSYSCTCSSAYEGNSCELELDECASSPCHNGATCVDLTSSYTCSCASGYTGSLCTDDIDECASSPCAPYATCTNGLDQYSCACPDNTMGTNCESDCRGGVAVGTHGTHEARIGAYAGCMVLVGDMIINSGVTSLSSLSTITRVEGNLYIKDTTLLETLSGLEGISNITGALVISNNALLADLDGLVGLRGIGPSAGGGRRRGVASTTDALSITNNPLLSSLAGLSGLTDVTVTGAVTVSSCDNLASLDGLQGILSADSLVLQDNLVLKNVSALSSCVFSSAVTIDTTGLPAFHDLFTSTPSLTDSLTITNNDALLALDGLEGLTSVGGSIILSNNAFVSLDCAPLSALALLSGTFSVTNHAELTVMDCTLPLLPSVLGVVIYNNTALETLSGFDALTTIGEGGISLSLLPSLTNATECFGSLTSTTDIVVKGLTTLASVENLFIADRLHAGLSLSGTITFQECTTLTDVHFNNITAISASIALVNLPNLRTISGFTELVTVTGNVTLRDNDALSSITGLQSLATISGYAVIVDNPRFCAGRYVDWETVSGGRAILSGNPSLSSVACLIRILSETPTNSSSTADDNSARLEQVTMGNAWLTVENLTAGADVILESFSGLIFFLEESPDDVSSNVTTHTLSAFNYVVSDSSAGQLRTDNLKVNQIPVLVTRFVALLATQQSCNLTRTLTQSQLSVIIRRSSAPTFLEQEYSSSGNALATLQPGFTDEIFGMSMSTPLCFDTKFIEYIGVNPFGPVIDNQTQRIDSNILGLTVSNHSVNGLTNATAVLFTFKHLIPIAYPRRCVYFDFDTSQWSSDGCEVISQSVTHTTCRCYHLTSFAVLADIDLSSISASDQQALTILTYVGGSLSIIACLYILLSFALIAAIRTRPQANLANMCVGILAVNITFLAGIDRVSDRNGCHAVGLLLYYFIMVTFAWTVIIANEYRLLLVKLKGTLPALKYNIILGWGVPALLTLIVLVIDVTSSWNRIGMGSASTHCWVATTSGLIGAVLIPIALVLIHNIFVFVLISRALCVSGQSVQSTQSRSNRRNVLLYFGLFVTMGFAWIFAYLALIGGAVFWYLFIIFNTSQGLLICLLFSLRGKAFKEVKHYIRSLTHSSHPSKANAKNSSGKDTSEVWGGTGTGEGQQGRKSTSTATASTSVSGTASGSRLSASDALKGSESRGRKSTVVVEDDAMASMVSEVQYTMIGDEPASYFDPYNPVTEEEEEQQKARHEALKEEGEEEEEEEGEVGELPEMNRAKSLVRVGTMIRNQMRLMPFEGEEDDDDDKEESTKGTADMAGAWMLEQEALVGQAQASSKNGAAEPNSDSVVVMVARSDSTIRKDSTTSGAPLLAHEVDSQAVDPLTVVVDVDADDGNRTRSSVAAISGNSVGATRSILIDEVARLRKANRNIRADIYKSEPIEQRKRRLKVFVEQRDALIVHYRTVAEMVGAPAEFDEDGLPLVERMDDAFEAIEPGVTGRARKT